MYQSLYTLISELIFNGTMNAIQIEVVTWLATCTSLFVALIPIIVMTCIVRFFVCTIWR